MFFSLGKNLKLKRVEVKFDRFAQNIFIGSDLIDKLISDLNLRQYKVIVPIIDENVYELHKEPISRVFEGLKVNHFIKIAPIELSKSVGKIGKYVEKLYEAGINRRSCILGIGGGVTGDAAGFLASVYMRGIDYVFLPTTTMSQGDSVIGKVGVGHIEIKNILGSFYSPILTYCDVNFIHTQDLGGMSVGLSEIIKSALIFSSSFTRLLEKVAPMDETEYRKLPWENIIYQSLKIKGKLVEKDQYDVLGIQKGLSYGHTIANVLEGTSVFHLRHGEAVALGMRIAGEVSLKLGILKPADLETQNNLLNTYGLIKTIPFAIDKAKFIQTIKKDKLSTSGNIDLVLLEKIGKFRVQRKIDESIFAMALEKFLA